MMTSMVKDAPSWTYTSVHLVQSTPYLPPQKAVLLRVGEFIEAYLAHGGALLGEQSMAADWR